MDTNFRLQEALEQANACIINGWSTVKILGWISLLAVSLTAATPPPADVVPYAGLSPQDACDKAMLPPGFKMQVFAAEPEVAQPIAFCLDDRGRVWVAEGRTYPRRHGQPPLDTRPAGADRSKPSPEQLKDIFGGTDRILVLEDTDGDHKADKRTVFLENLNLVSGIEVGFGGVWIGAAPYLMFVPVNNWDQPKPASDPKILLDGFDYRADTHETLNTFMWGPDGWLYGCHGVFCPSNVGKPGAPANERQWCDAAVWRYHPKREVFEVFTEGGSNPWGIDFDEYGQCWNEMCVIPHLFQMIQGGRIQRQGGEHYCVGAEEISRYGRGQGKPVHPHIYEDIKTHADHVHWAGSQGPHAGNARSDAAGGGHAHAGLMCYLGGSWPAEYRGKLFIGNIHGQRLNVDAPERSGSGWVGRHAPDFLNFNDTWSQTLNQLYDQDGSVYIIDWYDKNQCHNTREDGHDRSNGRVYKIVYNRQPQTRLDLAKQTEAGLLKLVTSKNEFLSRHARRILQERGGATAAPALRQLLQEAADTPARLRALWALQVVGGLDAATAINNLKSPDEWVRAWTIQLAFESRENLERLVREAGDLGLEADATWNRVVEADPSPVVRLYLASAAQRAPNEEVRAKIVRALLARAEDAKDQNLPLMVWYAMEPLVAGHPEESLAAALDTRLPDLLNFTTRRIAAMDTPAARELITQKLSALNDVPRQREMLAGLAAALKGQRGVPMPRGWDALENRLGESPNAEVRLLAQNISLTFGSQRALTALRKMIGDARAPAAARRSALESLAGSRDASLPTTLQALLQDADLRGAALRLLAAVADPKTPDAILAVYGSLDVALKRDALNTLVARPAYAKALMAGVAAGHVPVKDLTSDIVRQLRNHKDAELQAQVAKIYGTARAISEDKAAEIERYLNVYRRGGSQPGNASAGRAVFNKVCVQCHTLFDNGGKVGPDITGANRGDLNYLLETILDPNAVIPNEYRATEIETKDDRSLTGIVKAQTDKTVTLQTTIELLTLPRTDIASLRQSEVSMMPEGLLAQLTDQEVRDLLYYLSRTGQVPLPPDTKKK